MKTTISRSVGGVKRHSAVHTEFSTYRTAHQTPELAERLGICVKSGYAYGQDVCGTHAEKTPSVKLFSDGYKCFSCGNHGSNIDLVMRRENLDLWGACEWIARDAGLPPPRRDPEAQARYDARRSISQTYEEIWLDSRRDPERGIRYLTGRGVSAELIRDIVGYLPRNYEPADRAAAKRAGLYSKSGNFLFKDRVIIPIRSHGSIVNLYGRALDSERIPRHVYCGKTEPPQENSVWGLNGRRERHYYLTESIIDALTLETHGFPALAAFGTQSLTDERVEILKRSGVERITVCFDTDSNEAGQRGAAKVGEMLFVAGFDVCVLDLPLHDEEVAL
ncbi:MAG: toprim domain-containing protein [Pseudomonadota bacterium]